jgi:acyl carrier protein
MIPDRETVLSGIQAALKEFGFFESEELEVMDSLTYLALIVTLEGAFRVDFPDEILALNAFLDTDFLVNVIQELSRNDGNLIQADVAPSLAI